MVKRHCFPNIELIRAYLGLIKLVKCRFEALGLVGNDPFFNSAAGSEQSLSSARFSQRFDEYAEGLTPILEEAACAFLKLLEASSSRLDMCHAVLIIDVSPMDSSKTCKKNVSDIYRGLRRQCTHCRFKRAGEWDVRYAPVASVTLSDFWRRSNASCPEAPALGSLADSVAFGRRPQCPRKPGLSASA